MVKTMRNIVLTAILLIALAAAACGFVLTGGCSSAILPSLDNMNPFANAKAAATNAIIDTSGIKDRVESELHAHANDISAQTGIPVAEVNAGIEDLAVQDWQAVEKPASTVETASYSVEADGTPVDITTYDDESIVTVGAYGQEVTLEIPESAQQFTDYLPLLEYLQ